MIRALGALLIGVLLVGCGIFSELKGFAGSAFQDGTPNADLAIAEPARGNFAEAEKQFAKALDRNPLDSYAVLGLGVLYQSTDRRAPTGWSARARPTNA